MKKVFLAFLAVVVLSAAVFGGAVIEKVTGDVTKIDTAGSSAGLSANSPVIEGDKIITAKNSSAVVNLPDGSKLRVSEKTEFVLDEAKEDSVSANLKGGKLRAVVSKLSTRKKFDIKGPAVVCSVRGTEFEVAVDEKGKTTVHVFEGLVSARQIGGEEIMIHPNQKLSIEENMPPQFIQQTRAFQASQNLRQEVAKEVGLDMSRDQVQAAAALEMRNAEYQEGKTVVDVFGKRVRIDEYVLRPQADQFKMVVLNDRDDRFDYFTYKATFDKNLPTKLSDATSKMFERDTHNPAADYNLVSYEKARSNTQDSVVDLGSTDPTRSDKGYILDSGKYRVYFKDWKYKINSQEILKYDRTGYVSKNDVTFTFTPPGGAGSSSTNLSSLVTATSEAGIGGVNYDKLRLEKDSFWTQEDSYVFDDTGKIASTSEYNPATDISATELLRWNYQTIFTSSLFGGRKIDLVIEPKIMVNTGITQ